MKRFFLLIFFFFGVPALLLYSLTTLSRLSPPSADSGNNARQVLGAQTTGDSIYQAVFTDMPAFSNSVQSADARTVIIKNYLHEYHSPLEPYSSDIVIISDKYSLDYRLLVAIAQQESNLCQKIPENSFNCWGFGIYGDRVTRFENFPQALDTVARVLKRDYLDKGLDTPEKIMAKYTPPSLDKGGPWAKAVRQFLVDLE